MKMKSEQAAENEAMMKQISSEMVDALSDAQRLTLVEQRLENITDIHFNRPEITEISRKMEYCFADINLRHTQ